MSTNLNPPTLSTIEMAVRAWHAVSDHVLEGIGLDQPGCDCRNYGLYVKRVVDLFTGEPSPEPDGLGAVVENPLTGGVWVRASHPNLPPEDPALVVQQWTDAEGDWFTWEDLPQPLVMQSPGWTPPMQKPAPRLPEPTGLGAVVTDASGHTWVRVDDGDKPWLKSEPGEADFEHASGWVDLAHPVIRHTSGWERP